MDRIFVYSGQIPLETDILNVQKNSMMSIAKLCEALLGNSTVVSGLAVSPTGPATMGVQVAPGSIYCMAVADQTAFGSLGADSHSIMKQGILMDAYTVGGITAPGTAGQSQNYLIQAAFYEQDGGLTVLPYYNSANPSQAWSGPSGGGTPNYTTRKCGVTIMAKAGVAATTGSQTTPAPDGGYVGLAVVTVANGQATVTAGNITPYVSSPAIPTVMSLPQLLAPVGEVKIFAGNTAPSGYLECDGSAVSRTTYAALFTAIGTTYGVGNGTTTFNLPDLRGEFIRGWDHGRGIDSGRGIGTTQSQRTEDLFVPMDGEAETIIQGGMPAWTSTHDVAEGTGTLAGGSRTNGIPVKTVNNSTETRPRNIAMMYIIKY